MAQALLLKGVKDVVNYTSTDSTFSLRLKQNLRGGDVHQIKQWWAVNKKNTVYNPCTVFQIIGTDYELIIPTCVSSQLRIGYDGDVYNFIFSQYNQVDRAAVFKTDGTLCVEYQFPSISGGTILKRTLVTPGTTIGSLSLSGASTVNELNVGKNYSATVTGGTATGVTYAWTSSPASGVVINNSTSATASMVFVQDGSYTFTCTASDTGASNSPQTATISTTVTATTIGTVTVTGSASPTVSSSTNYTASTSGNSTNESYAWTCSPNTASLSGQSSANLTATFSAPGSYTLTCTVTDGHSSDNPQVGTKTVTVS